MASGCAVITTKVGEIPSTVSEDCAVLLDNPSADDITAEILKLTEEKNLLKSRQKAGVVRFEEKFSLEIYKRNWEDIISRLRK